MITDYFPVNDVCSYNRSSFSSRRIYSAIAISDPIFVLVYLLARLSESGDSKRLEFHLETAVSSNQLEQAFATVKF